MLMRTTSLMVLAGVVLAGCVNPLVKADSSRLNPPLIGTHTDDLRLGAAPPAKPSDVRLSTYNPEAGSDGLSKLRGEALKEAALSYGSQMGYSRRSWEVQSRLEVRSSDLSTVFDFNRVVSTAPVKAGVVIPPVVTRNFDAYITNDDGTEASVADEYLTIVAPGRLAPVAPTWRDYLIFTSPTPEEPARSLMPAEQAEMAQFKEWFDAGWHAGVEMADVEFSERVDRLKRDYTGMLQYRRLVAMGMMDRMVLADADFGTTTDGNVMRIDSKTVQIVSQADFQSNPAQWRVRNVSERDALIVETGEIPELDGLK